VSAPRKAICCEIYAARKEKSLPLKRRVLLDGRARTKRICWNVHVRFDLFQRDGTAAWLISVGSFMRKSAFYMPVIGINESVFRQQKYTMLRVYNDELKSAEELIFERKSIKIDGEWMLKIDQAGDAPKLKEKRVNITTLMIVARHGFLLIREPCKRILKSVESNLSQLMQKHLFKIVQIIFIAHSRCVPLA
jgi:hypothetical protein